MFKKNNYIKVELLKDKSILIDANIDPNITQEDLSKLADFTFNKEEILKALDYKTKDTNAHEKLHLIINEMQDEPQIRIFRRPLIRPAHVLKRFSESLKA